MNVRNLYIVVQFNEGRKIADGATGADQIVECAEAVVIAQGIFKGKKFHLAEDGELKEGFVGDESSFGTVTYKVDVWGVTLGFMRGYKCSLLKEGQEQLDEFEEALLADLPTKRVVMYDLNGENPYELRYDPDSKNGFKLFLKRTSR